MSAISAISAMGNYELGVTLTSWKGTRIPVPDDLVDPASYEIMRDPIRPPCGHTFDRKYDGNLTFILRNGCALCRARCQESELLFDNKKWERIRVLLDEEIPMSWHQKFQQFFRKSAFNEIGILLLDYSPTMLESLTNIAEPVYSRIRDVAQGRYKHVGVSPYYAECVFVKTIMVSLACIVRDVVLSLFFYIAYGLNTSFSKLLAKRVSLLVGGFIHFGGLCMWQPRNRCMYMKACKSLYGNLPREQVIIRSIETDLQYAVLMNTTFTTIVRDVYQNMLLRFP